MEYRISKEELENQFLSKSGQFSHRTNIKYKLFPFTGSTSDKPLYSFDNILGAFLRAIFSVEQSNEINRETIIDNICSKVSFDSNNDKYAFREMIKDIYFEDEHNLTCTSLNTYKYTSSSKNDVKISEYIVSTLCNNEGIREELNKKSATSSNILDELIESNLPKLVLNKGSESYVSIVPQLRKYFTDDLSFLIRDNDADFNDLTQLISFYYFIYTSQTILNLNHFCTKEISICPIFFCTAWEKTSKSRPCYKQGWRQIESKINTMFSHAVLLEMLNQTGLSQKFGYIELYNEYESSNDVDKQNIFADIASLKNTYRTKYAIQNGFEYKENNYKNDDINSLIMGFFEDIMLQFEKTDRKRANDAYKNSFFEFSKSNYLQNRKASGLMLVLSEEELVLLTKVIIGNRTQIQLNKLFDEFQYRGVYFDNISKECIVEFYEKLNLIEKKSDSGDAQYVKGIL